MKKIEWYNFMPLLVIGGIGFAFWCADGQITETKRLENMMDDEREREEKKKELEFRKMCKDQSTLGWIKLIVGIVMIIIAVIVEKLFIK